MVLRNFVYGTRLDILKTHIFIFLSSLQMLF